MKEKALICAGILLILVILSVSGIWIHHQRQLQECGSYVATIIPCS